MFNRSNIPGILLCFTLATVSYVLGSNFPIIGGPVFGILLGMLVTQILPNWPTATIKIKNHYTPPLNTGVQFTSKKLLQLAVILLGFEMNLFLVAEVGGLSLMVMLFTLSSAFLTAWIVTKLIGVPHKMAILIGVGTSICGGSAIAATAPVIQAESDDVAHAISTIFLFNIIAVFIFPPLGHALGLGDTGFGIWAGTAINDTSSVVAAATAWSNAAGNNMALSYATIVKLTRTLMIIPITLVLGIYTSKQMKTKSQDASYSFKKIFPWFVIGFLIAACIKTTGILPEDLTRFLAQSGKFIIIMAMTAIGLNTHLKKLLQNGFKPILLGLCCWIAVATVSLFVQWSMQLW